jgi:hypothetical protein
MTDPAVLSALTAAGEIADLDRGIDVRGYAVRKGMNLDLGVNAALVTMYAKCGDTEKGKSLLRNIQKKDLVTWSAIISSFAQNGSPERTSAVTS